MKKINLFATCPRCKKTCYAVSSVNGEQSPNPGDVNVCGDCHEILIFNDDLSFRMATADEIVQCHFPDLQKAHRLIDETP